MILAKELNQQKKKLLDKRKNLLRNTDKENSYNDFNLELSGGDDFDRASALNNLEINYFLSERKRMELKAIDRALKKMDKGIYGICEMCGKKIGKKRLTALPLTPYCRVCQSEME